METRANYILIGAFTLAGFLGILGFLLWFARVELDRQFAYYDVRFASVSGLNRAAEVRFAGLPVGQVVNVGLAPDGEANVLVRLEIDAATPVRADSIATIESLGVTGVSYVGISPGTPQAPRLDQVAATPVPEIESGRSALESLTQDAPEILAEVLRVAQQMGEILGEQNQQRVNAILANIEASSVAFAAALQDLGAVSESVAVAATGIADFAERLDEITAAGTATLRLADTALLNLSHLATRMGGTLDAGDEALAAASGTFASAQRVLDDDVPALLAELASATGALRADLAVLGQDARGLIDGFSAAGAAAEARLNEAGATIAATDAMIAQATATLASLDGAAGRFDALLAGDGAALVAETRAAIEGVDQAVAVIGSIAENELPALMADIRAATSTAAATVERVGADLGAASGRIDGLADSAQAALDTAADTFARATGTLDAVNDALGSGERTLAAAERAFAGADRVINEDISGIISQLGQSMERLDAAIAQVSDDIPAATAELRATAASANAAFAELGTLVTGAGPPVREFISTGLPQFTRIAQETRNLIASLERLTRQIEREPARFLLDRQSPEFRR